MEIEKEGYIMSYPKKVTISVPGTPFFLEVELKKWDCNSDSAHCHVCNQKGSRFAKVILADALFSRVPDGLSYRELRQILDTVSANRHELEMAYEHNRAYGLD